MSELPPEIDTSRPHPALELAPPGVVLVSEWRPEGDGPRPTPAQVNCYGGVARKP
jgi:S-adenosyl methyltransferase